MTSVRHQSPSTHTVRTYTHITHITPKHTILLCIIMRSLMVILLADGFCSPGPIHTVGGGGEQDKPLSGQTVSHSSCWSATAGVTLGNQPPRLPDAKPRPLISQQYVRIQIFTSEYLVRWCLSVCLPDLYACLSACLSTWPVCLSTWPVYLNCMPVCLPFYLTRLLYPILTLLKPNSF